MTAAPVLDGGFRAWGLRVSNRGRWGDDDRRGTLNLLTPARRAEAAASIRSGVSFSLALPLGSDGPQPAGAARGNPIHIMTRGPWAEPEPGGFQWMDDSLYLHTQCATQVDALGHVGYDGELYNGVPVDSVTRSGSGRLSVADLGALIHGPAVLLDIARLRGVPRLGASEAIGVAELEAAERAQGVRVTEGDMLLVRTGWIRTFTVDGDREAFFGTEPGLALETLSWLHDRGVAFLAADTWGVEVAPPDGPESMPFHCVAIRDMGLALGEMFDLEEAAEYAAREGRSRMHLSCAVLPITGGVGSPVAPIVTF